MKRRAWSFALAGLAVSLALAIFFSPFASSKPDGLDRFAEDRQIEEGESAWTHAPMGDYKVEQVSRDGISTGLAGAIGTVAVFGVALALGAVLRRRRVEPDESSGA